MNARTRAHYIPEILPVVNSWPRELLQAHGYIKLSNSHGMRAYPLLVPLAMPAFSRHYLLVVHTTSPHQRNKPIAAEA
jgi:hypothetical protein